MYLELFNGDHEKVLELNKRVCAKMGFSRWIALSGQTYTRKIDFNVLSLLSSLAQSAYKMCGDIRLLASMKEVEEPFGKNQIGSSAMAYKRNPMRCERVCSLARYLISLPQNAAHTQANQWFERTLDDSAIRRVILPEAFLAADVILTTVSSIVDGLHVWPAVIAAHIRAELPFMATEVILMQGVKAGGDRQALHEAIREHSMAAGRRVKEEGAPNDLMERIRADPRFEAVHGQLDSLVDPMMFVGRAPQQVDEFVAEIVDPLLAAHSDTLARKHVDTVNV